METRIFELKNNIEIFYKRNINTPRVALCLNFRCNTSKNKPGVDALMSRLLMQGTKTRSAEQLAEEIDSYAIELSTEVKPDYIRLKFLCLNEDFSKALEILEDIVKNSTFADFEKELAKMEGEIIAEMDSPRAKVIDGYYSTIFEGHTYGNTNSKILENIHNITKEDILKTYSEMINNSKKVISIVGDIELDQVKEKIEKIFETLPNSEKITIKDSVQQLSSEKYKEIIKPDANQAHIIKGWLVGSSKSEDYPALLLLNIILGASGLSSRLFLELRDKKGLAYVVRSCYETYAQCADFYIYIATEPKNIEVSLKGFDEEIEKIKNYPVSEEELENAKNNLLGKWAFLQETNNNQAISYANYGILDLGFDFNQKAKERIKLVTAEQIQQCAQKYFNENYALSILKP